MDAYIIGKLIGEFRIRKGYSQEELCYGICSVSSMSRIESGKQIPSKKTAEALLSRLGVLVPSSDIVMSKIEIERWNLEQKITQYIISGNCDIDDMVKAYEGLGEMDNLECQKILFFKTICENTYENNTNSSVSSTNLPVILFNLSNWYETKGDYEKSIEVAESGRKKCLHFGQLDHFPLFIMNRGWAYGKLGDMEKCKQDIDYAVRTMVEMEKRELAEEQFRCAKNEFPSIGFEQP